MNNIISIQKRSLNGQPTELVNARELHAFLEIGRDFSNWIKARIQQYSFRCNEDYVTVENLSSPKRASAKSRTQKVNDYFITLDMAKELAMVERNEKGRQARRYFIDCERELKAPSQMPAVLNNDKTQLINTMIKSMNLENDVVVLQTIDVINMVQTIRGYQQAAELLKRNPAWINDTIDRVKTMTGRNVDL
jgi:anti-repressor protein